ncbi:hypothetical protein [Pectobacterium brasiliense]|uniref:hypothetical protein n=1 Tax=Pectobacterium brasiliense TaxID=180957 RepID=UPI0032EF8946
MAELRVMPSCIVITVQDLQELWDNLPALSIAPFDEDAVTYWLNHFPSGLDVAGMRTGGKLPPQNGR